MISAESVLGTHILSIGALKFNLTLLVHELVPCYIISNYYRIYKSTQFKVDKYTKKGCFYLQLKTSLAIPPI